MLGALRECRRNSWRAAFRHTASTPQKRKGSASVGRDLGDLGAPLVARLRRAVPSARFRAMSLSEVGLVPGTNHGAPKVMEEQLVHEVRALLFHLSLAFRAIHA